MTCMYYTSCMAILTSIAILGAAALLALALIPTALRHLAAHIIAQAEAVEAYRRAHIEARHEWRARLGLPKSPDWAVDEMRTRLGGR